MAEEILNEEQLCKHCNKYLLQENGIEDKGITYQCSNCGIKLMRTNK